ncbi:hypothetical protein FQN52_001963 [Onygenales sp. PD_12]|nr:hypothetical protein FQN52_001963 [Onygenales sp. PD_12]
MDPAPSPDDMAEFQKLSNQYEPDLEGPLVGPKQTSHILATEYANADPVYVAKTTALSHTHSHYRIMKGDGNCGWRAVAFGYFETLFNLRDTTKVAQELMRIKSFNKLLDSVGQQEHLYEIFVDATEELLLRISQEIEKGNYDDSFLVQAFNEEYNSSAIITHFRLMTSAWMRLNPTRYADFLSIPLDQYCASRIDTVKTEIDEIGIQGLFDGVVEASGFALEIFYLDRSEGAEVNSHLYSSENPMATIRLLYRPGHYDILYQTELPVHGTGITPVNFQYGMTSNYAPWYSTALAFDLNPVLMAIPNIPMAMDPSTVSSPLPNAPQYTFGMDMHTDFHPPPLVSRSPQLPSEPSPTSSFPTSPVSTPDNSSELRIRINPLVYEPINPLPLAPGSFKNSPSSVAHFQNPNFQPTQWDPSEEYK